MLSLTHKGSQECRPRRYLHGALSNKWSTNIMARRLLSVILLHSVPILPQKKKGDGVGLDVRGGGRG